ncbi:MAG: hypothetical protein M1838_000394 [Thelocarpon superellum]|nr:MAG: hypothetical protein M1838_000394 [Thelocarpon superellum]
MKFLTAQWGMCLACLGLLVHFTIADVTPVDGFVTNSSLTNSSVGQPQSETRAVYLITNVLLNGAQILPPTYEKLLPVYGVLHFNATKHDGPLEIQLVKENGTEAIRVSDWGLGNADKPMAVPQIQPEYLVDSFELYGQTNLSNSDILNATTGTGLVHDVWAQHPSLALKSYNGLDFARSCIDKLGLGLGPPAGAPSLTQLRLAEAKKFWQNLWVPERNVTDYPIWLDVLSGWGPETSKSRAEFHYQSDLAPSASMVPLRPVAPAPDTGRPSDSSELELSELAAPAMMETYHADQNSTETAPQFFRQYEWIVSSPVNQSLQRRDDPSAAEGPSEKAQYGSTPDDYHKSGNAVRLIDSNGRPGKWVLVTTRSDSVVTVYRGMSVTKGATRLFAVASFVTSIVLVIDMNVPQAKRTAEGQKLVDAGSALVFLGIVVGIFSGGFGFLLEAAGVSMVTTGSFAPKFNIPSDDSDDGNTAPGWNSYGPSGTYPNYFNGNSKRSLSGSDPKLPRRDNVLEILRWSFFGDKDVTGQENFQAKNETGLFVIGPAMISSILGLSAFDAFAFLIHHNKGFPMTIEDMSKAFVVKNSTGDDEHAASITCPPPQFYHGRFDDAPPSAKDLAQAASGPCSRPTFSINRALITIPVINQTADQVLGRLMPQGDCVLVGDVTVGDAYPAYNMTIKGAPVVIACGIVSAILNSTAVSSAEANGTMPTGSISLGNQSSDGSSGTAYIAPPPPAPFQTDVLNSTNAICLGPDAEHLVCLPNGTYTQQKGSLGFLDTQKVTTLRLSPGSYVAIEESVTPYARAGQPRDPPNLHVVTRYTTNQSASDHNFTIDMKRMAYYDPNTVDFIVPSADPDVVCLFTDTKYAGDVQCFGPGGGDLPPALRGNVKSLICHGQAAVELFATNYSNAFAYQFDTYVDDLTKLPQNFASLLHAMWVRIEPGPSE